MTGAKNNAVYCLPEVKKVQVKAAQHPVMPVRKEIGQLLQIQLFNSGISNPNITVSKAVQIFPLLVAKKRSRRLRKTNGIDFCVGSYGFIPLILDHAAFPGS
jgi:hypothetical protein